MSGFGKRVADGLSWSLGAHGFLIYPRSESYPYGMTKPFEEQIGAAMPHYFDYRRDCDIDDEYYCFSRYYVKENNFTYKNNQKLYSGNQFFVDDNNVYSYWGSPYGDLPIGYSDYMFNAPDYDYMPYLKWVNEDSISFPGGRTTTQKYLFKYKLGGVEWDVPVNHIYKNGQLLCATGVVIVGVGVVRGANGKKIIAFTADGSLLVVTSSGTYTTYSGFTASRSRGGEWSDFDIDHVVYGIYKVSGQVQFDPNEYYEYRNVAWPFYEYKVSPNQDEFCILYQKSTTLYDNPIYVLNVYSIQSDDTTHGFTPVLASSTEYQATYTESGRPEGQQPQGGIWFSTACNQAPEQAWFHNNTGEEFEIPSAYAERDDQVAVTWNRTASLVGTLPLAVGYNPDGVRTLLTLTASDSLSETGDFQSQSLREYAPWDTKGDFIYYPTNSVVYPLGGARIGTSIATNDVTGSYSYTTSGTYTLSLGGTQLDQATVGQTVSMSTSFNETFSVTAMWLVNKLTLEDGGTWNLNYVGRITNLGDSLSYAELDLPPYYPVAFSYSVTSTKNTVHYDLRYAHIPSGTVLYSKLDSELSGTTTEDGSGNYFLYYDHPLYTFQASSAYSYTDVRQTSVYREIAKYGDQGESETVFSIPHTVSTNATEGPTKAPTDNYAVNIYKIDAYTGPGRPGSVEGFSGSFTFNGIQDNKVFFAADTRKEFIPWMLLDWIPANYNGSGNAQVTTMKASFQSPLASPGGWATEISPIGMA